MKVGKDVSVRYTIAAWRLSAVTQLGIETLANISARICQRAQEISDKMENALMMIIKVLCGGVLGAQRQCSSSC